MHSAADKRGDGAAAAAATASGAAARLSPSQSPRTDGEARRCVRQVIDQEKREWSEMGEE